MITSLVVGVLLGSFVARPAERAGSDETPASSIKPPVPASSTTTMVVAPVNPVIPSDFPDPDVVVTDGGYLAFATNAGGRHVQVSRSADLARWSAPTEALPMLPSWMSRVRPDVWAPDVALVGDRWVMAFAGREAVTGRMCIGLATADHPDQAFEPREQPLVCPTAEGGAIDPAIHVRSGEVWMYWKVDGNCCRQRVAIKVQKMDGDTLDLVGDASDLFGPILPWEGGVVEAPDPVAVDGRVVVLYSAGSYADASYAVGLVRCEAVTGACVRPSSFPLFGSRAGAVGPGGTSVFTARDGSTWIAYHAWSDDAVGYPSNGVRSMRIDRVDIGPDVVRVLGPS